MNAATPYLLAAYAAPAGPALLWAIARAYETPAWGQVLRALGAHDDDVAPVPAWRRRLRHARVVATLTLAVALAAALWPIAVALAHRARGRA